MTVAYPPDRRLEKVTGYESKQNSEIYLRQLALSRSHLLDLSQCQRHIEYDPNENKGVIDKYSLF